MSKVFFMTGINSHIFHILFNDLSKEFCVAKIALVHDYLGPNIANFPIKKL